ncbi:MAG: hypothetical protein VYA55_00965 [Pseudomonadota bacterium]|nr:hypothetical protein [Pseudomonadota bacterium]
MAVSLDDPTGMGANDVIEQLAFQTLRVGFVDRQVVLPRVPGEHLWTEDGHQEEEHQAAVGTKQAHCFGTPLSLGALLKDRKNIVNRSSICRVTSANLANNTKKLSELLYINQYIITMINLCFQFLARL